MGERLSLVDCTLRDGSYAIDYRWTANDTRRICAALEAAGVRWIEIGHGVGLNGSSPNRGVCAETDESYMRAAASVLQKAAFGSFFIPGIGRHEDLAMARFYGMGFVRIGTNATECEKARPFIEHAVKLGFVVSYNAMKSYLLSPAELARTIAVTADWGADIISIVDSAGCMIPQDVEAYVTELRARTTARISFHGHNNLQMANANSIAAYRAGASMLDATLQGIGRGGGNAQLEALVAVLDRLEIETGLDVYKLMCAGEELVRPLMDQHGGGGVSSIDVAMGVGGFHSSFYERVQDVVRRIPVDPKRLVMELRNHNQINPELELIERVAGGLLADSRHDARDLLREAL